VRRHPGLEQQAAGGHGFHLPGRTVEVDAQIAEGLARALRATGVERGIGQPSRTSERGQRRNSGESKNVPVAIKTVIVRITMEMYRAVQIALVVCWVVWAWPFMAYKARTPKRPAEVTVNASRWGIGLQMVGFFLAWLRIPGFTPRPWPWLVIALLLSAIAVVFSWSGVHNLGKQLRVHAGLYSDHELIRSGPYQIVRHPIYLGMLLMFLATALVMSIWPVMLAGLAIFLAGTEIRVRIEDRLLASRFGKQFEEYRAAVPAYIPVLRWIHLSVSMK